MNSRTLHRLIIKGSLLLLAGWSIYSFQRPDFYPLLLQLHPGTEFLQALPDFMNNNLPSLLHVWAMALLSAAVMPGLFLRTPLLAPGLWLGVNLIFECGQALDKEGAFLNNLPRILGHYFIQGRFDWFDLVACWIGACLALRTLLAAQRETPPNSEALQASGRFGSRSLTTACMIFGLLSLMATSKMPHRDVDYGSRPIYMPYEEFRNSFAVLPAQPIAAPGKIYVKDDLLLINDINLGIHVVDNRDPAKPLPIGFLKVLGSRDIAVLDHYLYVDSFVDFLVIDMEDPTAPRLVKRMENIFPWQPELWFPDQFIYDASKKSRGVIIGFETNSASQEN